MAVFFPFELIPYLVLALCVLLYCMFRFNTPEYGKASIYICGILQFAVAGGISLAFTNNSIQVATNTSTVIASSGLSAMFALWALLAAVYAVAVWLIDASKTVENVKVR